MHDWLNVVCNSFTGGAVISLFYEGVQRRCGSVAISIAYGPPSGGRLMQ